MAEIFFFAPDSVFLRLSNNANDRAEEEAEPGPPTWIIDAPVVVAAKQPPSESKRSCQTKEPDPPLESCYPKRSAKHDK